MRQHVIPNGTYVVRKLKQTQKSKRVYLQGIWFQSFIVTDENIKKYSIVQLKNGKVFKKSN